MMNFNQQLIAFYTLVRHELVRMFRISTQVFLPPVITTGLYFLIFGEVIGKKVGLVGSVPYVLFITPGLIMLSVITNAYGNVSTSLFSARFQKSIEEILVSPLSNHLLLWGYIVGGILRGGIVALLVFLVSLYFVSTTITHPFLMTLTIILTSAIFSLAGFMNALFAKTFDDVMLIPTFVLTPLTYLGGIFYSTDMLPQFWSNLSHVNPIFHMVNALRYTMIGIPFESFHYAMTVMVFLFVSLFLVNLMLLNRGTGLRE